MAGKRKIHGGAFKAQVALAAHKGDRTVNESAGHYGVRSHSRGFYDNLCRVMWARRGTTANV
jgi:hypothetical protein